MIFHQLAFVEVLLSSFFHPHSITDADGGPPIEAVAAAALTVRSSPPAESIPANTATSKARAAFALATPSPYGGLCLESSDDDDLDSSDDDDMNYNPPNKKVCESEEEIFDSSSDDDVMVVENSKPSASTSKPPSKPTASASASKPTMMALQQPAPGSKKPRDGILRSCAKFTQLPDGRWRIECTKCLKGVNRPTYVKTWMTFNATVFRYHLTNDCNGASMSLICKLQRSK